MLSAYVTAAWRERQANGWCIVAKRGEQLVGGLPPRALRPQQEHVHWLEMPEGWEVAYQALVSSKGRSDDRRKLRRLGELGELEFRIATSGEELQRALGYAFEIYRRRWQDRAGEAGGFASHESSWRAVGRALGERGHAQLVTLHLDGTPIAFTYSFLFGETMWGHRVGFDSELTQYSPGWLTIHQAIRLASAAGVTRVDFGLGNESYKQRLATGRTQVLWGTAVAIGLSGAIAAHVEETGFLTRQEAKQRPAIDQARQRAFRLRHMLGSRGRSRSAPAPL
jgi:CelD/BcsL family acetyltransferase involved in cellulose biosynthesis